MQTREPNLNSWSRSSLQVQHIMQPLSEWRVLSRSAVQRARVGDIVETFKHSGLRHLMVLATDSSAAPTESLLCGLFSASQFERALGITLDTLHRPNSFMEVESSLDHPITSPLLESNPWKTFRKGSHKWS